MTFSATIVPQRTVKGKLYGFSGRLTAGQGTKEAQKRIVLPKRLSNLSFSNGIAFNGQRGFIVLKLPLTPPARRGRFAFVA